MKNLNSLLFVMLLVLAMVSFIACEGDDNDDSNNTDGDVTTDGDTSDGESSYTGGANADCSSFDPDSDDMTCNWIVCSRIADLEGADDKNKQCAESAFFPCMASRCQDGGNKPGITYQECQEKMNDCLSAN